MCLLVQQPAMSFTDDFLSDVYGKNEDGLGIMYAEGGKLHVYKCLPASAQDFIDFYRKHADGRECIWHARMKTHGDIDLENCHPYRVTDDIWLAHNGVLSSGNYGDATKSDTWHFIKHVLRPALMGDPDLMLDVTWLRFIGDLIGSSNKFGLMRADGESAVVNKKSGVDFENAWLSNTYAWSPSRFGFRGNAYSSAYGGYYRGYYQTEEEETDHWAHRNSDSWVSRVPNTPSLPGFQESRSSGGLVVLEAEHEVRPLSQGDIKKYLKAAHNCWHRRGLSGVEQWVFDARHKAAALLEWWYDDVENVGDLVFSDPEEAAVWIDDLFTSDSIKPSYLA